MNEKLISKKDLLDVAGISYGQLYRWKRKYLIPEEWFIRKATFTGQETFFPKEKVLERIDKIQTLKENLSLDELAQMFSPNNSDLHVDQDDLIKRNIVSIPVLDFYLEHDKGTKQFNLSRILEVYVLEKLLQSGEINLDEGKMLLRLLKANAELIKEKSCELIITRKFGVSSSFLVINAEAMHMEEGTKIVARLRLQECIEAIKTTFI